MKLPFLLSALILPLTAAEPWILYVQEGDDGRKALEFCRSLLAEEEASPGKVVSLRRTCSTLEEARQQAKAIEDGVTTLPCLVLPGKRGGDNIALPLEGLTREKLTEYRQAYPDSLPETETTSSRTAPSSPRTEPSSPRTEPSSPRTEPSSPRTEPSSPRTAPSSPRTEEMQRRRFEAHLYLLCARVGLTPLDDDELTQAVQESRRLLHHRQISPNRQQFIGLRLLYPLLMEQYRRGYKGAHTPETEAKLLEAIAALEEAWDVDPQSTLGRRAYEERERLRMARRKSRQYE